MSERMIQDRRVHARARAGMEVVRYNRAGKWWVEAPDGRRPVSITEAASVAVWILANGGEVFFGMPGGKAFDVKVRRDA